MKKSSRIQDMVAALGTVPHGEGVGYDPCYLGWFTCFNAGNYYEAHEVLEQLWLKTTDENHAFFKGLIQIAGAFVHLRRHFERPSHPVDAARLRPAARLFALGGRNLGPFRPLHLRLDVVAVCTLCDSLAWELETSEFSRNPWNPARAPHIELAA